MHRSLLLFVLLAGASAAALDQADIDAIKAIVAAQRAIVTVHGTFTQVTRRADEPESSGETHLGVFDIQAPNRYNLELSKPDDTLGWKLRYCSDGVTRWTIERMMSDMDPDVKQRPVIAGAAAGTDSGGAGGQPGASSDLLDQLTRLLRLDDQALRRDFVVVPRRLGDGHWELAMTPRQADLAEQVRRIVVTLDGDLHTAHLVLDDPRGYRTTVTVDQASYNQPLPPERFTHQQPQP